MKIIISLFLATFSVYSFSQGLILDSKEYANSRQWEPKNEQGFSASDLPSKISYRRFAPAIQNQGDVASLQSELNKLLIAEFEEDMREETNQQLLKG